MQIPDGASLRDISPWYNERTIPRHLLTPADLPAETWGKVVVESGVLEVVVDNGAPAQAKPDQPVIVPPQAALQVVPPTGPVRFQIHYLHAPRLSDGETLAGMLSRG